MCKDIISMKGLEITAVCINRGPVKEVPCALTVKYSAALKRKEFLSHATWMKLKDIMLSGISANMQMLYDFTYLSHLK